MKCPDIKLHDMIWHRRAMLVVDVIVNNKFACLNQNSFTVSVVKLDYVVTYDTS